MPTKATVAELGYLGINTRDVNGWVKFITEVTGMSVSPEADDDGTRIIRMDERQCRLLIQPSDQEDIGYLGWHVADEASLDAIASQVEADGIEVELGTKEEIESRHVTGLIKFKDPSGLSTEIAYGPALSSKPFYPSRPTSGFKTGDLASATR